MRIREAHDAFGPLSVWIRPLVGSQYVIGVDVAEGKAPAESTRSSGSKLERLLDYSAAYVLDLDSQQLCAGWHGSLDTREYSKEIFRLGMYYNKALVAVETNGPGVAVADNLSSWEYPNLFHQVLASGDLAPTNGWKSSKANKRRLIDVLYAYLAEPSSAIPDIDLLREMQSMQDVPNKGHMAIEQNKDDRVFAFAIAHMVLSQERPTIMPETQAVDIYAGMSFDDAMMWKAIHKVRGRPAERPEEIKPWELS